jgi:hypothetical protein
MSVVKSGKGTVLLITFLVKCWLLRIFFVYLYIDFWKISEKYRGNLGATQCYLTLFYLILIRFPLFTTLLYDYQNSPFSMGQIDFLL